MTQSAVITARTLYIPGVEESCVSSVRDPKAGTLTYKEATQILKRKGLRYKDEATLIALVAAHRMLDQHATLSESERDNTAVIVASNLGNVDTVIENAEMIRHQHVDQTSVMALPNASSNVISATVAIVNQLRGPNLMLCNGDQSGLDAVALGMDLLNAGRAERVLVVAVEVNNPVVNQLFPSALERFHGAAGVLMTSADKADSTHGQLRIRPMMAVEHPVEPSEVSQRFGDASAVTGILQLLIAAEHAEQNEPRHLQRGQHQWCVEQ